MLRSFVIFAGFALISPAIRGYIFDAYGAVDELVKAHTLASYAVTGVLGFASFLAIRLTSKD
jgi:hypothetical protein